MSSTESFEVNKSMFELFRTEIQTQTETLYDNLKILKTDSTDIAAIENCMRSALSIKGAAQLVKISLALKLSASIENFLIFSQANNSNINTEQYTALVKATQYLSNLSSLNIEEHENPTRKILSDRDRLISKFESFLTTDLESEVQQVNIDILKTDIKNESSVIVNDIDPMMFELFQNRAGKQRTVHVR